MSYSIIQQQLKQMLECKICYEDKERQKMLPCQHTICLDCLNKLIIEGSSYRCPICNQELLLPNGGFEALQDSLLTKQLAGLMFTLHPNGYDSEGHSEEGSASPKTTGDPLSPGGGSPVLEVDMVKMRLEALREKEADVRARIKRKIDEIKEEMENVDKTKLEITNKITKLLEETIERLRNTANERISAINGQTKSRRAELQRRKDELEKAVTHGDELFQCPVSSHPTREELEKAQKIYDELEETAAKNKTSRKFKVGDSVRIKLEKHKIDEEFLTNKHSDFGIGYIYLLSNGDEECCVLFPHDSTWSGSIRQLELSEEKHNLPMIGDSVRVKPSVKEPNFGWANVKPGSTGYLISLKHHGPSEGRPAVVDFEGCHEWNCLFDELEKVSPEPLKIGEEVWIKKEVTEPSRGWAGVKPSSIGKLVYVNGQDVEVDFPEREGWKGLLSELERSRRIIVGDTVKVKETVTEPKLKWAGVDSSSVGDVVKIVTTPEHGEVCIVGIKGRTVSWKCLMKELEIVKRLTVDGPKMRQAGLGDGLGFPLGLPMMRDAANPECHQQ